MVLRDKEKCNLSEVVARPTDTYASLLKKIHLATVLGTIQSTFTEFRYLSPEWKANCEEERLLGVSITGIYDCPELHNPGTLENLKRQVIFVNRYYAEMLGIPPSVATTCVKPSGTVSQLVNSASGIHPRWASRYRRAIRLNEVDPICQFMMDRGFINELSVSKAGQRVFYFPIEAPEGGKYYAPALQHLETWKMFNEHWCEHKPSVTISVKNDEWLDVGAWVYRNFDEVSGISFLPHQDHIYQQAPYTYLEDSEFAELLAKTPKSVDWSELSRYDNGEDNTPGSREYACAGGSCEL